MIDINNLILDKVKEYGIVKIILDYKEEIECYDKLILKKEHNFGIINKEKYNFIFNYVKKYNKICKKEERITRFNYIYTKCYTCNDTYLHNFEKYKYFTLKKCKYEYYGLNKNKIIMTDNENNFRCKKSSYCCCSCSISHKKNKKYNFKKLGLIKLNFSLHHIKHSCFNCYNKYKNNYKDILKLNKKINLKLI